MKIFKHQLKKNQKSIIIGCIVIAIFIIALLLIMIISGAFPVRSRTPKMIKIYSVDKQIVYEGEVTDIIESDNSISFKVNDKQYTYYNCTVETISEK